MRICQRLLLYTARKISLQECIVARNLKVICSSALQFQFFRPSISKRPACCNRILRLIGGASSVVHALQGQGTETAARLMRKIKTSVCCTTCLCLLLLLFCCKLFSQRLQICSRKYFAPTSNAFVTYSAELLTNSCKYFDISSIKNKNIENFI